MEGAVRSGHNAASEVIDAIARRHAPQRGAERISEMETVGVMRSAQH